MKVSSGAGGSRGHVCMHVGVQASKLPVFPVPWPPCHSKRPFVKNFEALVKWASGFGIQPKLLANDPEGVK